MNRPDFTSDQLSADVRAALLAQSDETLAEWWGILNHWQWPDGLPDAEIVSADSTQFMHSLRREITDWIEVALGRRFLARRYNSTMTDAEFEDFYRGSYENDEAAFERYALRVQEIAARPLPRLPDGRYGRVNANDTPGAAARLIVTLDGELTPECYEANDVDGYVLCYVRDETGSIKLDARKQLMRERREGVVVISEKPDALDATEIGDVLDAEEIGA